MARLSLEKLQEEISASNNILLIQDLDGVCMPLVRDPLTRVLPLEYIEAVSRLGHSFRVLTNGEHSGSRGVNRLVERALGAERNPVEEGLYLPGLAAGGVQFQSQQGAISHPGVSGAELEFLSAVPAQLRAGVKGLVKRHRPGCTANVLEPLSQAAVLDNQLSPTLNLNVLFAGLQLEPAEQRQLQKASQELLEDLEEQAKQQGLGDSFFLHLAPNLGTQDGKEQLKWASPEHCGTSDFQFMLRGAVKEAGLLVLINQHIARQTGHAPLGMTSMCVQLLAPQRSCWLWPSKRLRPIRCPP